MKSDTFPLIGAHLSIAKGLHRALYKARAYGCTALQIFTKNASTWKERTLDQDDIDRFHQARKEANVIDIVSHTSYLINLATPEKKKFVLSYNALVNELMRSSMLDIPFIVLHPGAHMGKGVEKGIEKIAAGINDVFAQTPGIKTRLLFETTAGQGSGIGHTFEQLASIMDKIENQDRCGICLDTSHIFAAGYDIRTEKSYGKTINMFDAIIGINNLYAIHLNDSKKALGSRVDRHEHIGEGYIGMNMFKLLMNDKRFKDIPKIIETPKIKDGRDADEINLNRLRSLIY
ncbi:MAG: deoxyribonuclease IV [Desulfobacterales bacterium]